MNDTRPHNSLTPIWWLQVTIPTMNTLVPDDTIEAAIAQHDDPTHPDALTVLDVRALLEWLQASTEEHADEWATNIANDEVQCVATTSDAIVLSTGEENVAARDLREFYDGGVEVDDIAEDVVTTVIHEMARTHTSTRDDGLQEWPATYPFVVEKNEKTRQLIA